MQPTTSPTPSALPTNPNVEVAKTKKSNGLIIATVFCAILAIAGIAFGAYSFLQLNDKNTENDKLKAQIESMGIKQGTDGGDEKASGQIISNTAAQNIIAPYLRNFLAFSNALDLDFSEDTKAEITYLNISPTSLSDVNMNGTTVDSFNIDYYTFNREYQNLFGNSSEIEKKNYNPGDLNNISYSAERNSFIVKQIYNGGTGLYPFSIVKNATLNDESLVVEVYHDVVPLCAVEENNDDYCIDVDASDSTTSSNAKAEKFISEHTDKVPVYKMTFVEDTGHFVLKDIQKQ